MTSELDLTDCRLHIDFRLIHCSQGGITPIAESVMCMPVLFHTEQSVRSQFYSLSHLTIFGLNHLSIPLLKSHEKHAHKQGNAPLISPET